jgi:hypothetical protein
MKASGTFEVSLIPMDTYSDGTDGITLGRMAIEKVFNGDLGATSNGEMLSASTSVDGSSGYVAIEQVSGTLSGKSGSFVLQHFGLMQQGSDRLVLEVVPDSGTGELVGLTGKMSVRLDGGKHYYVLEYELD